LNKASFRDASTFNSVRRNTHHGPCRKSAGGIKQAENPCVKRFSGIFHDPKMSSFQ